MFVHQKRRSNSSPMMTRYSRVSARYTKQKLLGLWLMQQNFKTSLTYETALGKAVLHFHANKLCFKTYHDTTMTSFPLQLYSARRICLPHGSWSMTFRTTSTPFYPLFRPRCRFTQHHQLRIVSAVNIAAYHHVSVKKTYRSIRFHE